MNARAACLREAEEASCWKFSQRRGRGKVSALKDQRTPQYGSIGLAEFSFGLIYKLPPRRDEGVIQYKTSTTEDSSKTFEGWKMKVAKQRVETRPGPARSVVAKSRQLGQDGGISKRGEFRDHFLIFFVVMPLLRSLGPT